MHITCYVASGPNEALCWHTDASAFVIDGTLNGLFDECRKCVPANFSKGIFPAKENETAKIRDPLGLVYFLKRSRCK